MDQEGYARFCSFQGCRIVRAGGELWAEMRKFFLDNIPPHRRIHLSRWDAAKILLPRYAAIRYTCDETEGRTSYEFVLDNKEYDLNSVPNRVRHHIRQGLNNCIVRQIDFDFLAEQGCAINRSVFARQGRAGPPFLADEKLWKKYMASCGRTDDVEAWGAFASGKLCAYLIAVIVDDYAYSCYGFPLAEYMRLRPMNALFFTVFQNLLRRPTVKQVSIGLESFASLPDVEKFKTAMGFRRRSIGRQLIVNPLARPFLSRPAEWVAERFVSRGKFNWPLEDFLVFSKAYRERTLSAGQAAGPL